MTDIKQVYTTDIWRAEHTIKFLVFSLSVPRNRVTIFLGKPYELIQIIGLGVENGYAVERHIAGFDVKKATVRASDQLERLIYDLVSSDRFSSFTLIPSMGATKTVFRHQITFGEQMDAKRFADFGAALPTSCCERIDGCGKC